MTDKGGAMSDQGGNDSGGDDDRGGDIDRTEER